MSRLARIVMAFMLLTGMIVGLSGSNVAAQDNQTGQRGGEESTPSTDDNGSGAAGSYTSPTYGYSISYDESWTLASEDSQGGYDSVELDSEGSIFYLEGYPGYSGDPQACVDEQVRQFKRDSTITNFQVLEEDATDTGYTALLQATVASDSGDADLIFYLECRPLEPGVSVLVITQIMTPDVVDAQLARKDAIVETLEMGSGQSGQTEQRPEDNGTETPTASDEAQVLDLLEQAEEDIDAYWTALFEQQESWGAYEPPNYVNFSEAIDTACGPVEPFEVGPFECSADNTIYFDVPWMAQELAPFGNFIIQFVVAHEVGHHVQDILGIQKCDVTQCLNGYTSLQIELMADCFGGAWSQSANQRGLIAGGDVEGTIVGLSAFLGDPTGTDSADPSAHGPGTLRTWWFLRGYYEGPGACLQNSGQ